MSFTSNCFDKAKEHSVNQLLCKCNTWCVSQRSTCYWNKFYEKSEC